MENFSFILWVLFAPLIFHLNDYIFVKKQQVKKEIEEQTDKKPIESISENLEVGCYFLWFIFYVGIGFLVYVK